MLKLMLPSVIIMKENVILVTLSVAALLVEVRGA